MLSWHLNHAVHGAGRRNGTGWRMGRRTTPRIVHEVGCFLLLCLSNVPKNFLYLSDPRERVDNGRALAWAYRVFEFSHSEYGKTECGSSRVILVFKIRIHRVLACNSDRDVHGAGRRNGTGWRMGRRTTFRIVHQIECLLVATVFIQYLILL